ncbi:MAG: Lacal_2735 family protein [Bacteroidetes bacterium]|nr:MAG: Lacal_2735 family protein [Bacteroidota bacterium]
MLNLFKKDPIKKLQKKYETLLTEARDLQRSGDIKAFARKSAEAEEVLQEIDRLRDSMK